MKFAHKITVITLILLPFALTGTQFIPKMVSHAKTNTMYEPDLIKKAMTAGQTKATIIDAFVTEIKLLEQEAQKSKKSLNEEIPQKPSSILRIATWNVHGFLGPKKDLEPNQERILRQCLTPLKI